MCGQQSLVSTSEKPMKGTSGSGFLPSRIRVERAVRGRMFGLVARVVRSSDAEKMGDRWEKVVTSDWIGESTSEETTPPPFPLSAALLHTLSYVSGSVGVVRVCSSQHSRLNGASVSLVGLKGERDRSQESGHLDYTSRCSRLGPSA